MYPSTTKDGNEGMLQFLADALIKISGVNKRDWKYIKKSQKIVQDIPAAETPSSPMKAGSTSDGLLMTSGPGVHPDYPRPHAT